MIRNEAERDIYVQQSGDFRFISLFTTLRNAMEPLPNEYRGSLLNTQTGCEY
jgi:hypothetical protein